MRDRLTIGMGARVEWPGGGGFRPVRLLVNDRDLIDLVREVEVPFAGSLAGQYLHLNGSQVFLPSRNLLGEPYRHGFVVAPEDPRSAKSLLLQCTCGITECWFVRVRPPGQLTSRQPPPVA